MPAHVVASTVHPLHAITQVESVNHVHDFIQSRGQDIREMLGHATETAKSWMVRLAFRVSNGMRPHTSVHQRSLLNVF